MREILVPALRAGAITAFVLGLVFLLLDPPSFAGLVDLIVILAGALAIVLILAWATVRLTGGRDARARVPPAVDRSEPLATMPPPDQPPSEFDLLVMRGARRPAGADSRRCSSTPRSSSRSTGRAPRLRPLHGGTIARDHFPDRIVIYQDTLERDFGHNPELLRAQVERTVRHEVAHHLGWDEPGVRGLGL